MAGTPLPSYDKVFTESESQSLLSKCMLRYDPGNFSFKPRLFCSGVNKNLQTVNMNYDTERMLMNRISDHLNLQKWLIFSDVQNNNSVEFETITDPITDVTWLNFIHRNNYYINLNKLLYVMNKSRDPSTAVKYKNTRIYEAIVTLMIAITHYNSLIPHLKWICSSDSIDFKYDDAINMTYLENGLKAKNLLKCPIFSQEDNMSIPYMYGTNTNTQPFEDDVLELKEQMFYEAVVFSIEIFNRIDSIKDADLRDILYNLIVENSTRPDNEIMRKVYSVDLNTQKVVITPEVLNIIGISDMEKRYYAIRDFGKSIMNDLAGAAKDLDSTINCSHALGVNNFLAEFIKYCQNESIMNIRVKTIFILYNFCKDNKINIDESDVSNNSFPLPSSFGIDPNGNGQEMPESYSMMNMQMQQTIPDVQSEDNSLKKHAPERPPMFEELDKLNASFKHGMYEFDVKDIVDASDNAKNNYNAIASKMSLLNTNLIRSIKEIKVYNSGGKNPGKKTGKIDRKNLYKYKTSKDIFFDNTYKIKECDLAFGIILDESGSMRGEGVRNGVATLIVLHETLKALNINHSIISHNSSKYHQCYIKRFQTFKEDKPFQCNKNYAITNITGGRCNCDSGALYYMEQAFRRVKNKDKICLMFSDGEPTECSDTDLKEQIKHMEKAGIKVIGIGIDFPNIKEYYREYANGSSLKDMFDIVSNILKQYVLEKVDKE